MLVFPKNHKETGKPKAKATDRAMENPRRLAKPLASRPSPVVKSIATQGGAVWLKKPYNTQPAPQTDRATKGHRINVNTSAFSSFFGPQGPEVVAGHDFAQRVGDSYIPGHHALASGAGVMHPRRMNTFILLRLKERPVRNGLGRSPSADRFYDGMVWLPRHP
jgi:hypothetical protein